MEVRTFKNSEVRIYLITISYELIQYVALSILRSKMWNGRRSPNSHTWKRGKPTHTKGSIIGIDYRFQCQVRSNHACLPWLHDIILPQSIEVKSFGWGSSTQKILVREDGSYANSQFYLSIWYKTEANLLLSAEKQVGNMYENKMQTVKLGKSDLKCKWAIWFSTSGNHKCSRLDHNSHLEDKMCVEEVRNVAVCHVSYLLLFTWFQYPTRQCSQGDSGAGLLTTFYGKTFVLGVLLSGTDCEQLIHSTAEAVSNFRFFSNKINSARSKTFLQ